MMGIITLLLLGAFTMIYLSSSIPKKPPFFEKALNFLFENMKYLGVGGLGYGVIDAVITPIQVPNYDYMVVRLLADIVLVMMALPFCFDKIVAKYKDKVNAAIVQEVAGSVEWVRKNDKYVGGAGAILCILMFAFIFR